jgi:MFS family permease
MADNSDRRRSNWAPLKNRNFVVLLAGRRLSNWGDTLMSIALTWFVYEATHSVLDTALLSAVQRLGNTLAGPVAGVLVDRWDRRRTLVGVDAVNMGIVMGLAILAARHALGPVPIYAALLLMTGVAMLQGPAFHSVMSRVLPREDLAAGNGLYRSVGSANGFFASVVGGAIVAAVGAVNALMLDVGSFLFSMAALLSLRLAPEAPRAARPQERQRDRFWLELREGWAAVNGNPVLSSILLWLMVATAGGAAVQALLAVVVFQQLHGGPATLGLVEGAAMLGSVAGGLATGWLSRQISIGGLLIGCGGLMGLSYGAFGLSQTLWLSLPALALAGIGQAAMSSGFNAYFQVAVPQEVMGRAFGLLGAVEGAAGPLAALAGGAIASGLGAGVVLAAGGLWMGLSGLILLRHRGVMSLGVDGRQM